MPMIVCSGLVEANFDGAIRLGYQNHEVNDTNEDEVAFGINLAYETPSWHTLQIGGRIFTTAGNGKEGFEGVVFFDENNEDYAILGEIYLKSTLGETTLILGRQALETPFADSDDNGMVPNRFEAFTLVNTSLHDTTLFFSHVMQWSGVDSDIPNEFTKLHTHAGMQMLGITYEGIANSVFSGWVYHLENWVDIGYLEASFARESEAYSYGATVQYALQSYENAEDVNIYGIAGSLGVNAVGLTTTIAYNRSVGGRADNFFGGGPFVTSAEHNTIQEAGVDGNSILYTFEYSGATIGIPKLTLMTNINVEHKDIFDANEYDIGGSYIYSDNLELRAIYSNVENPDAPFKNFRMFFNYTFN